MISRFAIDKYVITTLVIIICFMNFYIFGTGIYNLIFVILNYQNTECLSTVFYMLNFIINIASILTSIYVFYKMRSMIDIINEPKKNRNYDILKCICMIQIILIMMSSIMFIFVQDTINKCECYNFWF